MSNILIKYNKKSYNWVVYINKNLFLTLFIKNKAKNKINSVIFSYYLALLKILRQFGLIKGIKNLSNFK